ncbi:MAG: MFS transporter [Steroidobacteraceae bacterium]
MTRLPTSLQVNSASTAGKVYGSRTYAWYVVVILTVTYTISFIDRQIMALMIGPIRVDLAITDTQVSLLIGLAFAMFYTLLGLPIARLADRYSRRAIISVGIAIWCAMTAACGMAQTYPQLFLARIGVGVGEAALSPSALSLISDIFPPERRGRAIAFYNMGISLGSGLAMIIGGQLIAIVGEAERSAWPVFGELYGWQKIFVLVGLPGLLMAILMWTVREPERRERLVAQPGKDGAIPVRDVIHFLGTRWRLYGSHFLGLSVNAILTYGFLAWIPQMFIRTWGWSVAQIGIAYGIITLISGALSVLFVAGFARYFTSRGHSDVYMRVALWACAVGVLGAILVPLAPTPTIAVLALIPVSVGTIAATGAGLTALMVVTPNQMRAQASAAYYLVVNLVGLTLGPTGIALMTDYVFRNDLMLRYSILVISALAGLLAAVCLTYNLRQYRKAVAESASWSAASSSSTH